MKLRHVNTGLLVATLLVCAYIILAPFSASFFFWIDSTIGHRAISLNQMVNAPLGQLAYAPSDERLVIPAMMLNTEVHQGKTAAVLRKGPWVRPNGSTPDQGGNTVIAAHRFTYTNPRGVFYYLDKLHNGDEIALYWQGSRYVFVVSEVKVVSAKAKGIEANTKDPQLTLYTCTPLWNPKDRLVIIAKPKVQT